MKIRKAIENDVPFLMNNDHHVAYDILLESIRLGRIYLLEVENIPVGWLRYNLFWDNTPFMNLLFVLEAYRGKGYGKALVEYFEEQMMNFGYEEVMTSTLVHETALHFYLKANYKVVGGFHPNTEEYEILLQKKIKR